MPSFLLKALLSDRPQKVLHAVACDRPFSLTTGSSCDPIYEFPCWSLTRALTVDTLENSFKTQKFTLQSLMNTT